MFKEKLFNQYQEHEEINQRISELNLNLIIIRKR